MYVYFNSKLLLVKRNILATVEEQLGMAGSFLKRVATNHPEIIGEKLYCSPAGLPYDVLFQLNGDGTISPFSDASKSFASLLKLMQELLEPNWKRAIASKDLFLKPDRKDCLSKYGSSQQSASRSKSATGLRAKKKCLGLALRPFNAIGYMTSGRKTQVRFVFFCWDTR